VREFDDEMAVLSGWLGRDLTAEQAGGLPLWSAFRFRDAAVFQRDEPDQRMYLVRGDAVREFAVSQATIDAVYAELVAGSLPAAA
jgi:hypothetical protein